MRLNHFYLIFVVFFLNTLGAQSTTSRQVIKFMIAAPQLDTVKSIWVYLPKNYQNSKKSYPTIYMHDAQNLFETKTSYQGEWGVDEYLDTLTNNQSIIIDTEHGNQNRINELTPYKNKKHGGGNGNAYLTFIKNTLKPNIDVACRTKPDAAHTTIFGSSLGDLISFYAVIQYPEIFGKTGVFSPSFWINNKIYDLVESSALQKSTKFYFLDCTDESENMIADQGRMVSLLKENGLRDHQIESHIIEGGQHNEKLWSSHFGDAYQWLYKSE
jgi:predicted alpha/beta superfamily hydrolase